MWLHLREQYGWVGDQYGGTIDRFDAAFLLRFGRDFLRYFGWVWVGAAVVALVAIVAVRGRARPSTVPIGAGGPLLVGAGINFVYCYFFPVYDQRFMVGTFVPATLFTAIAAGRALRALPHALVVLRWAMIGGSAVFLLANADLPGASRPALDLPALRFNLDRPNVDPDLRDEVLDRIAGARRVGLAGDHRSLNIDNLALRAFERRLEIQFIQVGYFGPALAVEEVLRRAGPVDAWVVVEPPTGVPQDLWTTRYARPVERALATDPSFQRLAWTSALPSDRSEVVLYRARATAVADSGEAEAR